MTRIATFALAALIFTACNSSDKAATTTETVPTVQTPQPVPPVVTPDTLQKAVNGNTEPISVSLNPTDAGKTVVTQTEKPAEKTTAKTNTATADTATVNPAHGLPGHRCDLAVGAPLPKATAKTKSSKSGEKLNPPHGEPGHDCSIPVGKPLKS